MTAWAAATRRPIFLRVWTNGHVTVPGPKTALNRATGYVLFRLPNLWAKRTTSQPCPALRSTRDYRREYEMRFVFPHSHAFPGGRVAVENDGKAGPECLVEFGDGATVIANWRQVGPDIVLTVPSYRTIKGTQIEPKSWYLAQRKDGVWRSQRTRGRLLSRQKQGMANDTEI